MENAALGARLATLFAEPQHRDGLLGDGFAVIDDALDPAHAHALREEMCAFERAGDFQPNRVQFSIPGRAEPIVATKPGVFEIDLHDAAKRRKAPHFSALFDGDAFVSALQSVEEGLCAADAAEAAEAAAAAAAAVATTAGTAGAGGAASAAAAAAAAAAASALRPVRLVPGTQGKTIKLQVNHGGAFPVHYDNPGRPNRRRWTCLLYLNPGWATGDGGEVVLLPFGATGSGRLGPMDGAAAATAAAARSAAVSVEGTVTVPPLFNRLLVFRSDLVLHRVLTAARQRFCFTVWVDAHADDVNRDSDVFLKQKHLALPLPDFVRLMRRSPLQRVVSRAVYADAYEASLLMCIRGKSALVRSPAVRGAAAAAAAAADPATAAVMSAAGKEDDAAATVASRGEREREQEKHAEQQQEPRAGEEEPLSEGSRYMIAAHRAQVRALVGNPALGRLIHRLREVVVAAAVAAPPADPLVPTGVAEPATNAAAHAAPLP